MIENAWLAPRVYPGWRLIVFYDKAVPQDTVRTLHQLGCRMIPMDEQRWPNKMFPRFLVHDLPEVERYLIRDADSRLCARESVCVQEWIVERTALHVIRDHPYHLNAMMGGGWGLYKPAAIPQRSMADLMQPRWSAAIKYGQDQDFLASVVWPLYWRSSTQHDTFKTARIPGTRPIPFVQGWPIEAFCFEIFDEHNRPNEAHRAMRLERMQ